MQMFEGGWQGKEGGKGHEQHHLRTGGWLQGADV